MTDDTIHTCSYSCERPGCIRAQRDELVAKVEALRAEVERLAEALECMIIGACAVAVPHNGERAVLQDAVNIARKALAAYRKGAES